MPLLKPREMAEQLAERDEHLDDYTLCGEGALHDCYVGHEQERVKERRYIERDNGIGRRSVTGGAVENVDEVARGIVERTDGKLLRKMAQWRQR